MVQLTTPLTRSLYWRGYDYPVGTQFIPEGLAKAIGATTTEHPQSDGTETETETETETPPPTSTSKRRKTADPDL